MEIIRSSVFNSYDLKTDPDIVAREAIRTKWGMNRRNSEIGSTFMMLGNTSGFGGSIGAKKPEWAIGDYPDERTTLTKAVTITNAQVSSGTEFVIELGDSRFIADDMLSISVDIAGVEDKALIRVRGKVGDKVYKVVCLHKTLVGNMVITTANVGTVIVLSPAVTYDDSARSYLNVKADMMFNFMQRSRETVGAGQWETGETFFADHSLGDQIEKGFESFRRKITNSIYSNTVASTPATKGVEDFGTWGGLPYFLNPTGLTSVTTTAAGGRDLANEEFKGINKVLSGWTTDGLNEWSTDLFERGNDLKMLFCKPTTINKIITALNADTVIHKQDFGVINPAFVGAFSHPTIELSYGRLMLVADRGATAINQKVKDATTSTFNTSHSDDWAVAIDPTDIGFTYYTPNGKGAQTPTINDIAPERNSSIEESEFDTTMTMVIGDPRQHGYVSVSA